MQFKNFNFYKIQLTFLACLVTLVWCQEDEDVFSFSGEAIEDEPEIKLTPVSKNINLGDQIYSRCSVEDSTDPFSIKWIQRVPGDDVRIVSNSQNLFISSATELDLNYPLICKVTRLDDNEVFEKTLPLQTILYRKELVIKSMPRENLQRGYVVRKCSFEGFPDVNYQYDFKWIDQYGRIYQNGNVLYLMLNNIDDLKNYRCEATHKTSGRIHRAQYKSRHYRPSRVTQHMVNIIPVTEELLIGRPYEMVCKVTPMPNEQVRFNWFYKNQMIESNPRLSVPSLAYENIGVYSCRAEWTPKYSRSGSMSANATLELSLALTAEPMIEMSPPPGSVMVSLPGETRELHCEFDQRNPQEVSWYFENQLIERHPLLNSSGNVYRLDRLRVSIIILKSVETHHAGTYECRIGSTSKQTHLIVRNDHGLEINPVSETVNEGNSVEFHCRVKQEGWNNKQLSWYFKPFGDYNRIPLVFDHNSRGFRRDDSDFARHTSFISKRNAQLSDEGEYICVMPNQNMEVIGKLMIRPVISYKVLISPPFVRVRPNEPIEFECYTVASNGQPSNVQPTFEIVDSRIRFNVEPTQNNRIRLRISGGLDASQNGTQVKCSANGSPNPAFATIYIEGNCPEGYRRCRSGKCLPAGRFCDGTFDCEDRSDEDPQLCNACEPVSRKCEHFNNKQPSKDIYMIHWTCDGESDCGNGFDEQQCQYKISERCHDGFFTCKSDNRRIPMAFVCDKDRDCSNNEDEISCSPPVVLASGIVRKTVPRGSQVVLTCEVTGNPAPYVIWRFNWGCLPNDSMRYNVTNVARNCQMALPTVTSTLVISNVRPGDDGIYNCEGLAGPNRVLSENYFVMLEN